MTIENYIKTCGNQIYDYKDFDLDCNVIKIYSKIENLFQKLIKDYSEKYGIGNYYFHFKYHGICSSSAANIDNSLNVINISSSYPLLMYKKLYESNIFDNDGFKNLYRELIKDIGFDFNEFFLECSVRFTFFHEFRHLLQFENKKKLLNENIINGFSQERHLFEIDADSFAIRYVMDFVYDQFEKLENKNENNFKNLSFIALGSVFTTNLLYLFKDIHNLERNEIEDFNVNFYIKEKSHPHTLIRNANIIQFYIENININYPINLKIIDVLKFPFEIINIYFNENITSTEDLIKKYMNDFMNNCDEINSYIDEIYNLSLKNDKIIRLREKYTEIL